LVIKAGSHTVYMSGSLLPEIQYLPVYIDGMTDKTYMN